jgi:hypothetical protein
MLSPKEKAAELIQIFGKELAPKVVDQIQKCVMYRHQKFTNDRFSEKYWDEVKTEIENNDRQNNN